MLGACHAECLTVTCCRDPARAASGRALDDLAMIDPTRAAFMLEQPRQPQAADDRSALRSAPQQQTSTVMHEMRPGTPNITMPLDQKEDVLHRASGEEKTTAHTGTMGLCSDAEHSVSDPVSDDLAPPGPMPPAGALTLLDILFS